MKKVFLTLSLILTAIVILSAQQQIKNFEELMESLKKGHKINAVFDYTKCQLVSDNEVKEKSPEAVGGMMLDAWEYFAAGAIRNKNAFVVASTSKLIENPIGEGMVYNYVKIKISDDSKVKITARYIDAKTFEIIMDENFFTTINNANDAIENAGAAYLYKEN